MGLTRLETQRVLQAARRLVLDAPSERAEDFIARILGLNAVQQGTYFPDPDPQHALDLAVAELTRQQQDILWNDAALPSFAVYKDVLNVPHIAGLRTYLALEVSM